jgi:hypothetical protein
MKTTLNFMDTETVSQIYARVSRERARMEESQTEEQASEYGDGPRWHERHAYLCEVEQSLETVVGFLNGEHAAFHEQRDAAPTYRERFLEGGI